jgi:hypothetical protein
MGIRIVRGATAWDMVRLVLRKGLLLMALSGDRLWNEALMRRLIELDMWRCAAPKGRRDTVMGFRIFPTSGDRKMRPLGEKVLTPGGGSWSNRSQLTRGSDRRRLVVPLPIEGKEFLLTERRRIRYE